MSKYDSSADGEKVLAETYEEVFSCFSVRTVNEGQVIDKFRKKIRTCTY